MAKLIETEPIYPGDAYLTLVLNKKEIVDIIQKLSAQIANVGSGSCPEVLLNYKNKQQRLCLLLESEK